jgi:hypothetical protein
MAVDTPAPHGFYVPFIILGYHAVYGRIVDPLAILSPAQLEDREDGNVLQWADGRSEGLRVDAAMGRRLGVPAGRLVLRKLFSPAWITEVLESHAFPLTPIGAILQENDLAGGWAPTRPIIFMHSPDDRDLPMANATLALERLSQAVREDGRDPAGLLELRPLGRPGEGIDHVLGIFPGISRAFSQIEEQRQKPTRAVSPGPRCPPTGSPPPAAR